MVHIVETLLSVQEIERAEHHLPSAARALANRLRKMVPAGILMEFDRRICRGERGVALLRNGTCSECHREVSCATVLDLAFEGDIQYCEHCGRLLYLPEDEPLGLGLELLSGRNEGRTARDPATHAVAPNS